MKVQEIIKSAKTRMGKSIQALETEFATIRTSRATPALVENIKVEYYGAQVPLKQIASITIPEARMIVIQPWDPNALSEIEKAILKSELGVTPNNDGKIIRIILPPLTEERRQELVKLVKKLAEEAKIAIRNIRRDANEEVRKLEKDSEITEDDRYRTEEEIQKLTDEFIEKVEKVLEIKEKEILEE
ncbi:MAG TPA: ribosome recycling factor [Candidatus Omnitrophica bacterium]|nr:ribosome recycling factor [Candidatus Omnitrophota bacterium]